MTEVDKETFRRLRELSQSQALGASDLTELNRLRAIMHQVTTLAP